MFNSLYLFCIMVMVGVLAVLWYATRIRPEFVIRIRNGSPQVVQGKATDSIVKGVADVCRMGGVRSGTIRALRVGKRMRLKCSSGIPAGCQQQLRNMMLAEM